jgi:predicted dithiol-disulfide oxidoreductase (DUF899 family)
MTENQAQLPEVASRGEWREARRELLEKEKELTHKRDELNAERRRLPMVAIDKDYAFEGPDGEVSLLDLFEGRRQLVVYHFMFDPEWDEGCPSCSFVADNIGHLAHLHARDTSLAMVSRAPVETLEVYKNRMDWAIPWYSSYGSEFNYDFHVTIDASHDAVEYNYRDLSEPLGDESTEGHGLSVFLRDGDDVYHTYSTYARGVERLVGTYNYLDLTPLGRGEKWEEPAGRSDSSPMGWLRRHDDYDDTANG